MSLTSVIGNAVVAWLLLALAQAPAPRPAAPESLLWSKPEGGSVLVEVEADWAVVAYDKHKRQQEPAVTLYRHDKNEWIEFGQLALIDPHLDQSRGITGMKSLAIQADVLAVGAKRSFVEDNSGYWNGEAHVFERINRGWESIDVLYSSLPLQRCNQFGESVAVAGDSIVVGDPKAWPWDSPRTGLAFVYRRTARGWREEARLHGHDSGWDDRFGHSVSICGDRIAVGAPGFREQEGAVYFFEREGTGWTEVAKISPEASASKERFGSSVKLLGNAVAVGAPDGHPGEGSAYVFEEGAEGWEMRARLKAEEAGTWGFGAFLDFDGKRLAVGAQGQGRTGKALCSVHLFDSGGGEWLRSGRYVPRFAEFAGLHSLALDGSWLATGQRREWKQMLMHASVFNLNEAVSKR
jgi:hypothetical protein